MARVIGDIVYPNGQYIDQEGQERTSWLRCGILLETDKGMRIKLESIPVGVGEGGLWFSVFEKDNQRPRQQQKPAQKPAQAAEAGGTGDVPF